jgi:hypothetical protein
VTAKGTSMSDVLEQLLAHEAATTSDPASRSDIDAVARRIDAPLPELLAQRWRRSDGVAMQPLDCLVLGPSAVLQLLDNDAWFDLSKRGLLPIVDDHQSNLLAVFTRGPRAFRVAHLAHDDDDRLLYRDVEGCFRGLLECADQGSDAASFFYETQGDYPPDEPRCDEDQEAARELLAAPHELDEWNHAAQLLDAGNLAGWRRLLETDHFVRRDARERMRKMSSPAIKALLAEDQEAFDEFVELAANAARQAGMKVGPSERDALQVGGKWMNMDAFFHRRRIPNAVPRMLAWFEDVIAGRDPNLRPGNFMAD